MQDNDYTSPPPSLEKKHSNGCKVLPDLRRSGALSFLPTWPELKKFVALGVPTLVALTGQVATCMAVTFAASGCDTVALAAHQVNLKK